MRPSGSKFSQAEEIQEGQLTDLYLIRGSVSFYSSCVILKLNLAVVYYKLSIGGT